MAVSTLQIAELYVATFNRAADNEGLNYWAGIGDTVTDLTTIEEIAASFLASPEAVATLGDDREALVVSLYQNVLGRDGNAAEINYWTNISDIASEELVLGFINGALGPDKDYLDNKTEVAVAYADAGLTSVSQAYSIMNGISADDATVAAAIASINAEAGIVAPVVGQTIALTTGSDILTGTSESDSFEAYLGQNAYAGGVSNTLSSADKLDGGDGADSLYAQLVPEFFGATADNQIDIQARTSSIETVEFEARDINFSINENSNNIQHALITVDAKDMTGVSKIGSTFSDGDLKIENLTTLTDGGSINAVSSMTITMDHTDNMNSDHDASDLTVLFDEDYLTPTTSFGVSGIEFKMMNQDAYDSNVDQDGNAKAVGDDRLDGVFVRKMVITLDGHEYDLAPYIQEDGATGKGEEFKTETALVTHLNTVVLPALRLDHPEAAAAMESLVFTVGSTWNDQNQNRIGDIIVLSVSNEFTLTIGSTDLELAQAEDVPNDYASNRIERADNYTGADSESISVNIELDKVGRDGEGGNIVVGGKDQTTNHQTDVDQTDGIPIFNVTVLGDVDRPSNLGMMTSTNGKLTTVNVTSEDRTDGSYAALTIRGQAGDLDMEAGAPLPFGGTLDTFNANTFLGDLYIGQLTPASNIDTFTATGGGDVTLYEVIGTALTSFASLDANVYTVTTGAGTDTITIDAHSGAQVTVATAGGNDTISVAINGQDTSGSNLTTATINSGSGDNTVTVISLDNAHSADITLGSGADTVYGNSVNITASTGSGNDVVYTSNLAAKELAVEAAGASAVATTTEAVNGNTNHAIAEAELLYGRSVMVTLSTDGLASNRYNNGFESISVDVVATNGYLTTELDLYTAIAKAINDDSVLSTLATASIDSNGQLSVAYIVDGVSTSGTPTIEYAISSTSATSFNDLGASAQAGILAAVQEKYSDSGITSATVEGAYEGVTAVDTIDHLVAGQGADSVTGDNNTVNVGTGDDVIVLSSDDGAVDTVVFDTNAIGNDTIVHFEAGAAGDLLDFTAWLDNQYSISTSTVSRISVDTNLESDLVSFEASSVVVALDTDINTAYGTALNFNAYTDAQILAALNGTSGLGGATASTFAVDAYTGTATFVGSTQKAILLIENTNNDGQYTAVEVSANNATGDSEFTAAHIIGTVDFGDTMAFNDANFVN